MILSVLILCAGCLFSQKTNETGPAGVENSGAPVLPQKTIVEGTSINISSPPSSCSSKREALDVLCKKPLMISGDVRGTGISEVLVWLLDDNISVYNVLVGNDETFRFTFNSSVTGSFSSDFSPVLIVHYPVAPDNFVIAFDQNSGEVIRRNENVSAKIISGINERDCYPTTLMDYFDQAISDSGTGDSCMIYILNAVDGWIEIYPVENSHPGVMEVSGATSLPAKTPLSLEVSTLSIHPTPKNYDYSHEFAGGESVVVLGEDGINYFSSEINTSRLNTGKYIVAVESRDDAFSGSAYIYTDIISPQGSMSGEGNYINWSALSLPPLIINESIAPEIPDGELKIVPSEKPSKNNDISYGSVMHLGTDGIWRVFDSSGVQVSALYDSNEAHIMEVPNGAAADTRSVGNVTFIRLGGEIILTKIDEFPRE